MAMYKITLVECLYDERGNMIVRHGKLIPPKITVYDCSLKQAIEKIKLDLEITDDTINTLRISSAEEILE
jgi:hypothetical protein